MVFKTSNHFQLNKIAFAERGPVAYHVECLTTMLSGRQLQFAKPGNKNKNHAKAIWTFRDFKLGSGPDFLDLKWAVVQTQWRSQDFSMGGIGRGLGAEHPVIRGNWGSGSEASSHQMQGV